MPNQEITAQLKERLWRFGLFGTSTQSFNEEELQTLFAQNWVEIVSKEEIDNLKSSFTQASLNDHRSELLVLKNHCKLSEFYKSMYIRMNTIEWKNFYFSGFNFLNDKFFFVLDCLVKNANYIKISDLKDELDISAKTMFYIVKKLQEHNFIEKTEVEKVKLIKLKIDGNKEEKEEVLVKRDKNHVRILRNCPLSYSIKQIISENTEGITSFELSHSIGKGIKQSLKLLSKNYLMNKEEFYETTEFFGKIRRKRYFTKENFNFRKNNKKQQLTTETNDSVNEKNIQEVECITTEERNAAILKLLSDKDYFFVDKFNLKKLKELCGWKFNFDKRTVINTSLNLGLKLFKIPENKKAMHAIGKQSLEIEDIKINAPTNKQKFSKFEKLLLKFFVGHKSSNICDYEDNEKERLKLIYNFISRYFQTTNYEKIKWDMDLLGTLTMEKYFKLVPLKIKTLKLDLMNYLKGGALKERCKIKVDNESNCSYLEDEQRKFRYSNFNSKPEKEGTKIDLSKIAHESLKNQKNVEHFSGETTKIKISDVQNYEIEGKLNKLKSTTALDYKDKCGFKKENNLENIGKSGELNQENDSEELKLTSIGKCNLRFNESLNITANSVVKNALEQVKGQSMTLEQGKIINYNPQMINEQNKKLVCNESFKEIETSSILDDKIRKSKKSERSKNILMAENNVEIKKIFKLETNSSDACDEETSSSILKTVTLKEMLSLKEENLRLAFIQRYKLKRFKNILRDIRAAKLFDVEGQYLCKKFIDFNSISTENLIITDYSLKKKFFEEVRKFPQHNFYNQCYKHIFFNYPNNVYFKNKLESFRRHYTIVSEQLDDLKFRSKFRNLLIEIKKQLFLNDKVVLKELLRNFYYLDILQATKCLVSDKIAAGFKYTIDKVHLNENLKRKIHTSFKDIFSLELNYTKNVYYDIYFEFIYFCFVSCGTFEKEELKKKLYFMDDAEILEFFRIYEDFFEVKWIGDEYYVELKKT